MGAIAGRLLLQLQAIPSVRVEHPGAISDAWLATVDQGVVFMLARWSGTSSRMLDALCRVLEQRQQRVVVYVIDLDEYPEVGGLLVFRGRIHGHGETFWVQNGAVVSTASGRDLPSAGVLNRTFDLLELP